MTTLDDDYVDEDSEEENVIYFYFSLNFYIIYIFINI